jgi:hypothetical protein
MNLKQHGYGYAQVVIMRTARELAQNTVKNKENNGYNEEAFCLFPLELALHIEFIRS